MPYGDPAGTVSIIATGLIQTSIITPSTPNNWGTRIYNIHLISTGTASVLTISNGASGTVLIKVTGTISTGAIFDFGVNGVTFPNGAFATVDANIVSASIGCRAEQF